MTSVLEAVLLSNLSMQDWTRDDAVIGVIWDVQIADPKVHSPYGQLLQCTESLATSPWLGAKETNRMHGPRRLKPRAAD